MILASHQPDFFPYMGYFYKIFQSDIFVFSDNVQYSKTGRHNYNEILTYNGPRRLTLPIHYHVANLNEIQIAADEKWVEKTQKMLWLEYKKAEHFHEVFPAIEGLISKAPTSKSLADFNLRCILFMAERFGLDSRTFILSSDLELKERKDARIIEMCGCLGADVYVSGDGAKDYHIEAEYLKNGIRLRYSDYQPVIYPQAGKPTTLNMSVIDYVMNCGFNLPRGWKRW